METTVSREIIVFDAESEHLQLYSTDENTLAPTRTCMQKQNVAECTAVSVGDHVYVIAKKGVVHRLRCFSTNTGWERLKDAIEDHGPSPPAVAMEGHVYLAGGAGAESKVERYDPSTGEWKLLSDMKIMETVCNTLVTVQGHLYSIGGKSPRGFTRRDVERLDPASWRWNLVAPMREERRSAAAVAFDGKIIVLGGFDDCDNPLPTTESFDPSTNVWMEMRNMLKPRAIFDAFIIRGEIYIFDKKKGQHCERYDVGTRKREEVQLPRSMTPLAAAMVGSAPD